MPGSIGILESPDKPMPIGEAHCVTWDQNGLAVWTLRIGKEEIPGRWVIVDREFRPASPPDCRPFSVTMLHEHVPPGRFTASQAETDERTNERT